MSLDNTTDSTGETGCKIEVNTRKFDIDQYKKVQVRPAHAADFEKVFLVTSTSNSFQQDDEGPWKGQERSGSKCAHGASGPTDK